MSVASLSVETSVRSLLSMLSFSNLSRFASGTRFLTTRRRPSFRKNKVYKKSPLTPAKQRLLKIVDQAYELSMIESSDIIFPGEEVNLVGRISVDKQDLAQGKSYVIMSRSLQNGSLGLGTVCTNENLSAEHRVQVLAIRQTGAQKLALVKDVDSCTLRRSHTDFEERVKVTALNFDSWIAANVEWCSEDNMSSIKAHKTVPELFAAEAKCEDVYKDLCTCLRLYRAFHWAKSDPPVNVALSKWQNIKLIQVAKRFCLFPLKSNSVLFRDNGGVVVLHSATSKSAPFKTKQVWSTLAKDDIDWAEKRLSKIYGFGLPISDQNMLQQVNSKIYLWEKQFGIYITRRRKILHNMKSRAEQSCAFYDSWFSIFRNLQAAAHEFENCSVDTIIYGSRQEIIKCDDERSLLYILDKNQDAFSYAVAAQLKSLGAGITTERLQQYLEAPTTLARLTLLAADLAHIKEQLTQDALARGVLTAEQLQQLEEIEIGDTRDLESAENLPHKNWTDRDEENAELAEYLINNGLPWVLWYWAMYLGSD